MAEKTQRILKRPSVLTRSFFSFGALIDQGFFIFAAVASFWLAWLVWREAWHTDGWWIVGLFVAVWGIMAYLALPRLHRILSSIYVPNYFIGRTRTADGLLGDPVNVALRGSEAQIHAVMTRAGWTRADEVTAHSSWRIITSTIFGKQYDAAPVSSLFLFGRRQNFAYQQQVDGNPKKRHHVRFWRCPRGWLLPGGHQVDWLAAGTYDRSVGLSLFTFQVTHKIDENTDIERDYIVDSVCAGTKSVKLNVIKDFSTGYHSRNGGGDAIKTDGDLPILELKAVRAKTEQTSSDPALMLDHTAHEHGQNHETLLEKLWTQRPPQILFGSIIILVILCVSIIGAVTDLIHWQELWSTALHDARDWQLFSSDQVSLVAGWIIAGAATVSTLLAVIELFLVWAVMRGSNKARLLLLSFASFAIVTDSLSVVVGKMSWITAGVLLSIGLHIVILQMFSSDNARLFTKYRSFHGPNN